MRSRGEKVSLNFVNTGKIYWQLILIFLKRKSFSNTLVHLAHIAKIQKVVNPYDYKFFVTIY